MTLHKKKILFISPSDISKDSRILKQIDVAKLADFEILALGIKEINNSDFNSNSKIISINLYSRMLKIDTVIIQVKFFINLIQSLFIVLEIMLKFLPIIIKFRPNIIHCSDYTFLPLAISFKGLTRAKIIYDVHELESQTNSITKLTSNYIFWLEKSLLPFVDVSLHVSESIQRWYKHNFGWYKSEIILNSPIINQSSQNDNYFRNTFKIPENIKIFLYLGILDRGRGIETALNIFKELESKAAIVFMGHGGYESKIRDYSQKFNNIFVHHPVPHNEVVSIASSADFGYCVIENASLSDYFCLPNKLFECVFSGLPVLASKFPDISNVVKEFNLGILTDLNELSINQGISQLIVNQENTNFLDKDLYPLSWNYQSKKLEIVFKSLVTD